MLNVFPHGFRAPVGIPSLQGGHDLLMLDIAPREAEAWKCGQPTLSAQICHCLQEQPQNLVACRTYQDTMKLCTTPHRLFRRCRLIEALLNCFQRSEVLRLAAEGGQTGYFWFQEKPYLGKLFETSGQMRQPQGNGPCQGMVQIVHHSQPPAMLDLEEPLRFQPLRGFAQDGSTHPQLYGQLSFGRKPPKHFL